MLYRELAFVSVITRLFSPNHAQNGVSYTIAGSTATCISGVDTCTISDVKAIDVIKCNDAKQCIINCDEKKGLESAQIFVQNSPNFTLNVSGEQCMKNAAVDVSTASNARIVMQSDVRDGLKTAKVDAQNAQFLLIDVMSSASSFGWPQVYCPSNSAYSGPEYDAPCVMNNSEGGGSDVSIYVSGGYPKDFQYLPTPSVDSDAFSSLQVYMGCASGDADESADALNWLSWDAYSSFQTIIQDGSSNVCYATKTPTKVHTKTPTQSPTKTPSKAHTKLPTSTPSSAPTKLPTTSPTKLPTESPVPPLTAKSVTSATTTSKTPTSATNIPTQSPIPPLTAKPATMVTSSSTLQTIANEHEVEVPDAVDQDEDPDPEVVDSGESKTTSIVSSQSYWRVIAITFLCLFLCVLSLLLCCCYMQLASLKRKWMEFQNHRQQGAEMPSNSAADSFVHAENNMSHVNYVQLIDMASVVPFAVPPQSSIALDALPALPPSRSILLRSGEESSELRVLVRGAAKSSDARQESDEDEDESEDEENEMMYDDKLKIDRKATRTSGIHHVEHAEEEKEDELSSTSAVIGNTSHGEIDVDDLAQKAIDKVPTKHI